jgi:hypothetical protein
VSGGVTVAGIGLLTGWGPGVAALPDDPRRAAAGRTVVGLTPRGRTNDRLRRATRECLLAVDAVEALLEEVGLDRAVIAGDRTALVYVTAAAYGASNRAFVEGGGGALHFPYTAPSAVPAEVAIEFGLCGPYTVLIGGATATIDALGHAGALLARGACDRAVVLAVETFAECEGLHDRGGIVTARPLVEAAAAVLLERGERIDGGTGVEADAAGTTLACAPLIALARAVATGTGPVRVAGRWRGREASLTLGIAEPVQGR